MVNISEPRLESKDIANQSKKRSITRTPNEVHTEPRPTIYPHCYTHLLYPPPGRAKKKDFFDE